MIPRAGISARAAISGSQSQTSEAVGSSTSRSNRFFPVKTGVAPSARSRPGTGGIAQRRLGREIKIYPVPVLPGDKRPGPGLKRDCRPGLFAAGLPEHECRGKRRVAAEFHFLCRGKPPQVPGPGGTGWRNAVSEWFSSAATCCIHAGSAGPSMTQTPAGFPRKGWPVKASTTCSS